MIGQQPAVLETAGHGATALLVLMLLVLATALGTAL